MAVQGVLIVHRYVKVYLGDGRIIKLPEWVSVTTLISKNCIRWNDGYGWRRTSRFGEPQGTPMSIGVHLT